ncbi:MAG: tail fiber protein [Elusimicrobia bacterium]|nr:tail fiber protein [Elusimicrobiota bacterium]
MAVAVLVAALSAGVAGAVQLDVMLQGYLTNATGTPYTGPQKTEFKVYQGGDAGTAGSGSLVYDEASEVTPSASGVFSYLLGSGTPVSPTIDSAGGQIADVLSTSTFDTALPVYVEISVNGTTLLPRLRLAGTPFAAIAGLAESLKPVQSLTTQSLTASSGTFTAAGPGQYSIAASSGISVAAGGVTAPYFSGAFYGDGSGLTGVSAAGTSPIGTIIAYAGTVEPPGWIECDGRAFPQNGVGQASWGTFNTAPLFAALSTVWGSPGAGMFNIPDLRGTFLRGWNHGKSGAWSDPDAASRVAEYPSGAVGDAVGSYQADKVGAHTHPANVSGWLFGNQQGSGSFQARWDSNNREQQASDPSSETRPRNAAVMFLLRVQ